MNAHPILRQRAKVLLLEAIDVWRGGLAEVGSGLVEVAVPGHDLSAHMAVAAWAVYEAAADAGTEAYDRAVDDEKGEP